MDCNAEDMQRMFRNMAEDNQGRNIDALGVLYNLNRVAGSKGLIGLWVFGCRSAETVLNFFNDDCEGSIGILKIKIGLK